MCFDVTNLAKTCHKRRPVAFTYSLSVGVVFRLQVIPLDLLALCCENGQSSTILAWCSVHLYIHRHVLTGSVMHVGHPTAKPRDMIDRQYLSRMKLTLLHSPGSVQRLQINH